MFSCGHDTEWQSGSGPRCIWIEPVRQPTPPGQQQQPTPRKTVAKDGTGKKPSPGSDHAAPDPPVPPPAPNPTTPPPVPPPAPAGSDACTVRTTHHQMKYTHRQCRWRYIGVSKSWGATNRSPTTWITQPPSPLLLNKPSTLDKDQLSNPIFNLSVI